MRNSLEWQEPEWPLPTVIIGLGACLTVIGACLTVMGVGRMTPRLRAMAMSSATC